MAWPAVEMLIYWNIHWNIHWKIHCLRLSDIIILSSIHTNSYLYTVTIHIICNMRCIPGFHWCLYQRELILMLIYQMNWILNACLMELMMTITCTTRCIYESIKTWTILKLLTISSSRSTRYISSAILCIL